MYSLSVGCEIVGTVGAAVFARLAARHDSLNKFVKIPFQHVIHLCLCILFYHEPDSNRRHFYGLCTYICKELKCVDRRVFILFVTL